MYVFGGAAYHVGFPSPEAWTLGAASRKWQLLTPYGVLGKIGAVAYHPVTHHVLAFDGSYNISEFDPSSSSVKLLTGAMTVLPNNNGMLAVAIDPVSNVFVAIDGDQYVPKQLYNTGPALKAALRGFDMTSNTPFVWDDPSCDGPPVYHGMGFEYDSVMGMMVGYPGFGNQVIIFNSKPTDQKTAYGLVPSHKCLRVTIGSTEGVDYPPYSNAPVAYTGVFGNFRYFPSLDIFVVVNDANNNAWTLHLQPNPR
jgi:hypothetical protein